MKMKLSSPSARPSLLSSPPPAVVSASSISSASSSSSSLSLSSFDSDQGAILVMFPRPRLGQKSRTRSAGAGGAAASGRGHQTNAAATSVASSVEEEITVAEAALLTLSRSLSFTSSNDGINDVGSAAGHASLLTQATSPSATSRNSYFDKLEEEKAKKDKSLQRRILKRLKKQRGKRSSKGVPQQVTTTQNNSSWLDYSLLLSRCDLMCPEDALLSTCLHGNSNKSLTAASTSSNNKNNNNNNDNDILRLPEADFRRQHSLSAVEVAFVRSKSADLQIEREMDKANENNNQHSLGLWGRKQQSHQSSLDDENHQIQKTRSANDDKKIKYDSFILALEAIDRACFDPGDNYNDSPATVDALSSASAKCTICDMALTRDELDATGRQRKTFPCCKNASKSGAKKNRKKNKRGGTAVVTHNANANTNICAACLLILTIPSPTADGQRIGRCPLCRGFVCLQVHQARDPTHRRIHTLVDIGEVTRTGQCETCHRRHTTLVHGNQCDGCFLGQQQTLQYECLSCAAVQRIPYPLYRYQEGPAEYTDKRWRCDACRRMTYWRLCNDQVPLVLLGDAPWQAVDWQTMARLQVASVRNSVVSRGNDKRKKK